MVEQSRSGDREYVVFPAGNAGDTAVIEAAATAIVRLFEAVAIAKREVTARAAIEAETALRVEQFRTGMALLEKQLDSHNALEASRQQSWFAVADKLIERGKAEIAVTVLEMAAREGKGSLVQPLIDYHRMVTLGLIR